jgi:hypothetical protein
VSCCFGSGLVVCGRAVVIVCWLPTANPSSRRKEKASRTEKFCWLVGCSLQPQSPPYHIIRLTILYTYKGYESQIQKCSIQPIAKTPSKIFRSGTSSCLDNHIFKSAVNFGSSPLYVMIWLPFNASAWKDLSASLYMKDKVWA